MRKPNSHECIYFGRKLSSLKADIESTFCSIHIGSSNDDKIYYGECLDFIGDKEPLKERVILYAENDYCDAEIDLEDILVFARKYCNGIFERIATEVKPENWQEKG